MSRLGDSLPKIGGAAEMRLAPALGLTYQAGLSSPKAL
jgi:hypothetical protein